MFEDKKLDLEWLILVQEVGVFPVFGCLSVY